MDTFRLLTRSMGLRVPVGRSNNEQKFESGNVPPEGTPVAQSRKRKREAECNGDDVGRHSETLKASTQPADESIAVEIKSKSPKSQSPSDAQSVRTTNLSEDQCRSIFKEQKIKITDLRFLHNGDKTLKKKAQKEAARIFPQPLLRFKELQTRYEVNPQLAENVAEQGFYEPTEVQLASLPLLLEKPTKEPDLITVAPTGSGKTLAFLIPLVNKIIRQHHKNRGIKSRHIHSVILAPTRELESQIVNEGRKLIHRTGVTISAMKKGMRLHDGTDPQDSDEQGSDSNGDANHQYETVVKSDILVSTPLSLLNSLENRTLPDVTSLVLDEADVLLDPLFREQTVSIWSACTNPSLQTSLWSATIGSSIEALALETINQRHAATTIKQIPPLFRVVVGLKDSTLPEINHKLVYAATEPGKLMGLRQLLHPPSSHRPKSPSDTSSAQLTSRPRAPFLIFTQTIERASALASELAYDIPTPISTSSTPTHPSSSSSSLHPRIAVLHSSLTPHQRTQTMNRFRAGQIWVLITTDLLSRGVDFRGINTVVNYDIPTTVAGYLHRAGRTGRRAANHITTSSQPRPDQYCITLYTKEDVRYLHPIASLIDRSTTNTSSRIPSFLLPSLPAVDEATRRSLRNHGVPSRRGIRRNLDDERTRREKRRSRIGTRSGYDKAVTDRRKGAVEGSRRRKEKLRTGEEEWEGIGD